MSKKIDLSNASIGQLQIGDNNSITVFNNLVEQSPFTHPVAAELKKNISELYKEIELSNLETQKRESALKEMEKLVKELQTEKPHTNKINISWEKVINVVKDLTATAGIVKVISELLKLSV